MSNKRTQAEMSDTCDKACEILKKTNDGDTLDPSDLKLTELAVNGFLNDTGREVFEKLYKRVVVDGTYSKPYLHGIEHLTRDHEGYIYYKGIHIEHYDRDYVYSEAAKIALLDLKRRCEFLECRGLPLSSVSLVWGWDKYAEDYGEERLKELEALLSQKVSFEYSRVEIYNSGRDYTYFVCGKPDGLEEIKDHPVTQGMIGRYFDDEYEIKVESFIYGDRQAEGFTPSISDKMEIERLLASCHDYLLRNEKIVALPIANYKTDFAEGYESTKRLESLLGGTNRILQYSEIFMYGYGSDSRRLYICGIPTFDEIKTSPDYMEMKELYEDRLTVSATAYQYGTGTALTLNEIPNATTIAEALEETHYYLQKHDLSYEIGWRDFTRDIEVGRGSTQSIATNYEAEDSFEL